MCILVSDTNILFHFLRLILGGKIKKLKKNIEVDLDNSKLLSLQMGKMGKPSYLE